MKAKKINPLHLDQQLCFGLYSASRLMTKAYGPFLDELDLTYPQYLVMLVLWENDGLSVKEIGKRLELDSGTLSPLLKKLIARKLVIKDRDENDERTVCVRLTSEGVALEKKAAPIPTKMFCKFSMKEKEFLELRDNLQKLIKALQENE